MSRPSLGLRRLLRRAANGAAASLGLGALAGSLPACSVDTLPNESRPAVANSCKAQSDCGPNRVCSEGACYSKNGNIDEVLLEIIPEASSPLGAISFLSMQSGLRRGGDPPRAIALAGPVTFTAQVQVSGDDPLDVCPYLRGGKQTVPARIQFVRVGSVGGVSVTGLSNRSVTVDTEQSSTSGFNKDVSLVPGFYDIYAQPVASNCEIAPKLWRGVEVVRDGPVVAWAPPSMLELPPPLKLNGKVTRGDSLADWQVEILDPQDGRVISTSARLGATTKASPTTNFAITYQPLEMTPSSTSRVPVPLIRLAPPKGAESTVPTVYFELASPANGQLDLDLSNLPTSSQLVMVSGQVHGPTSSEGVRATVKFFNSTFPGGLTAAFGPTVTTDAAGRYTTKLFPGKYNVVVIPEGATDNGSAVPGANAARLWALTEGPQTIGFDADQVVDLEVLPTRILQGVASAGSDNVVAQGATLEASPLIASSSGVLRTVLSPPVFPARASVDVDDKTGKFTLVLDPGDYDLFLKPAAASNFAWWILPDVTVVTADMPGQIGTVNPQLLYPVSFDGILTVTMQDKTSKPLGNATVQAYAPTPYDTVTQVGIARTDDMGRYRLALPPAFGALPTP